MYLKLKRFLDFIFALAGSIVLSPVLLLLCIAIRLDSKGPAIFKQRRIGINKREFNIFKLRTMYMETPDDMPTHMLCDAEKHITRVGRTLRRFSLDEIPQIFNILKGDMSVVGPRPALWNQFDLIAERDKYNANSLRPGLTGWAQINGRDELSIEEKARLDGEYVERISFLFDLKCVLITLINVIKHKGVAEGGINASKKELS